MLEIEMKFPVADFQPIVQRLKQWGARVEEPVEEADHYFNAPDRDFAQTDEAFRLRRSGAHNRITYKGARQAGPTKTRTEIEVGLEDGPAAADVFGQLVEHLGFRPVAVVRKRRTIYHVQRDGLTLEVCCDEVERLGHFIEVEVVAPEAERESAQQTLLQVKEELGLKDAEPRSYLHLILELGAE